jgi:hypothetical protein
MHKAGDRLLAIEQYNVSTFSPKVSQRILNDLPWPKVLVFEVRYDSPITIRYLYVIISCLDILARILKLFNQSLYLDHSILLFCFHLHWLESIQCEPASGHRKLT